MSLKRVTLVVLLAAVLVPSATAGTIDILFAGGTWSWAGGVGSHLNASSTTVLANGNFLFEPLTIQSGPAVGGNGSLATPFVWGAGGNIAMAGCGGPCFSGTFTAAQLGLDGSGGMTFVGSFISGSVSPVLLSFLGLNPSITNFDGLIHFDVSPKPVSFALGSGRTRNGGVKVGALGSGDLHIVQAVPEPGTLWLLGSGVMALAGTVRRKLSV